MDGTSRHRRAALSITWPPAECLLVLSVAHNWLKPPHLGLEQTFTCSRSRGPEQIAFWQRTAAHDKEKNVFAKFNAKIWESFNLINGSLIFIYHHITSVWCYNLYASKQWRSADLQNQKRTQLGSSSAPYDHHRSSVSLHAKSKMSKKDHPVWKTHRYLKDSWEWRLLSVNVHEPLVCVYNSHTQ